MAIGIRLEPELEQQLDRLADSLSKTRIACVSEAIARYLSRFNGDEEAKRQSSLIAASSSTTGVERTTPQLERLDSMSSLQIQRGQVITVARPGAYSGKPRPAVVVQANRWLETHPSITLCPLTSTLIEAPLVRINLDPSAMNSLRKRSQLMIDKLFTLPIGDIGSSIGSLESTVIAELEVALRDWLALH